MTISNAFGSTFAVFPDAQSQPKNSKRATKPTHNDTTFDRQTTTEKEGRTHNTGLAKVAVQCSASTFVLKIATFAKPQTVMLHAPTDDKTFRSDKNCSISVDKNL